MTQSKKIRCIARLAIVLTTCIALNNLHATLMVNATVTPTGGGLFNYEYSITNNEVEDVSIVSITDAPFGDPNIDSTLLAPAGLMANYDPGLGIVDFLEDIDLFGIGTTKNGFTFTSAFGPASNFMTFEALTVNGNFISGQVQKDIRPDVVVPEPGTIALLAFGLGYLSLIRKRKGGDEIM